MAMNPAQCKAACLAYMDANLKPLFNTNDATDFTALTFDVMWTIITEMAAITIQHIIDHAQCNGLDSHNDTHSNVGII